MQTVIQPIDPALVQAELTPDRLLRHTNKGGNRIYVVDGRRCPNVMRELGRLREVTFRAAGGGTGKDADIDAFDLMDPPCRQLLVWDPENRIILGGYRYITGKDIAIGADGTPRIATASMFAFSDKFVNEYLPYTIELGRSFVRLEYQSSRQGAKALFALDNLWDGLGALTVLHPEIKYLFGKFTMYPAYPQQCRNMLLYFIAKHFPDPDGLVRPLTPLDTQTDTRAMQTMFAPGNTYEQDYRTLNAAIRAHGINIPPLVNSYMSLSPTMRTFGTAINHHFGQVEETAIMVTINEIYDAKKQRHIDTFNPADNGCGGA